MDQNLKSNKILFSIVIPVYNVENYLIRCLKSIFEQHCDFVFEVIAVDDCSTDNSLAILIKFSNIYSNLKILKLQKNMKLSVARMKGINEAKGEYIVHIDSDDWIIDNGLNIIGNEIINRDFDVVVFNYFKSNSNNILQKINLINNNSSESNKNTVKNYFLGSCWNKVVRRSLHENLIFGQIGINSEEDLLYNVEIMSKSNNFKLSSSFYYVYFQNHSSITLSINSTNFLSQKPTVLIELYKIFKRYGTDKSLEKFIVDYFEKWIYLFVFKIHNSKDDDKSVFSNLLEDFSQINEFDNYRYKKIEKTTKKYFISFIEVIKLFGFKIPLSIMIRSKITNRFKY